MATTLGPSEGNLDFETLTEVTYQLSESDKNIIAYDELLHHASVLFENNDYENASTIFLEMHRLKPHKPEGIDGHIRCLFLLQRYQECAVAIREALLYRSHIELYEILLITLKKLGLYDQCLDVIENIKKHEQCNDEKRQQCDLQKVIIFTLLKQYKVAESELVQMNASGMENLVHIKAAVLAMQQKKLQQSRQHIDFLFSNFSQSSYEDDPKVVRRRNKLEFMRCLCDLLDGQSETAFANLRLLMKYGFHTVDSVYVYCVLVESLGKFWEELATLEKLSTMEHLPSSVKTRVAKAIVSTLCLQNKSSQAQRYLERYLQKNINDIKMSQELERIRKESSHGRQTHRN